MATIIGPVVPVGRGDGVIAMHVYHASDLATTRELAALRATVADQALTIAGLRTEVGELRAELAARPRWYVVRVSALRAPEWALPALGVLARLGG